MTWLEDQNMASYQRINVLGIKNLCITQLLYFMYQNVYVCKLQETICNL
jgi:hypothetical protein